MTPLLWAGGGMFITMSSSSLSEVMLDDFVVLTSLDLTPF